MEGSSDNPTKCPLIPSNIWKASQSIMHSAFSGRSTKTNHHTAKDQITEQERTKALTSKVGRFHKPLSSNDCREFLLDLVGLSPLPTLAAEVWNGSGSEEPLRIL